MLKRYARVLHLIRQDTPRERQVLALIVDGETSRDIADDLGIRVRTVETHRNNIMTKLGVRNVAALVRYAIEHHLA